MVANLIETEFPEENPTIDDIKQYYGVGEVFETNCTSNSSIPPAKLEWWINDMPMYNAEYTIKYNTIVDPVTNRETSILGLRLPLTNEHFYRGRVKVSGLKNKKMFPHIGKSFSSCFILAYFPKHGENRCRRFERLSMGKFLKLEEFETSLEFSSAMVIAFLNDMLFAMLLRVLEYFTMGCHETSSEKFKSLGRIFKIG